MKLTNALIIFREDMYQCKKYTSFHSIDIRMFPFFASKVSQNEDFVIFVDEDGRSKILKNRLGNPQF